MSNQHEEMSNTPIGDPRVFVKEEPLTGGSIDDPINSPAARQKALDLCKSKVVEMLMAPLDVGGYDVGDEGTCKAAVDKAEFVVDQWRAYLTVEAIAEKVYTDQHWWVDDTNIPVDVVVANIRDEQIIE